MMWFRQIAQLSTTISQAHRATAFHCSFPVSMASGSSEPGSVYLLDLKLLLAFNTLAARALGLFSDRRITHLHVGHAEYWI